MIAYHGTSKRNAAKIKREGFKRRTYFARHMEDALEFGGNHIFVVEFSDDPDQWKGEPDGWQFWIRQHIPSSAIISCYSVEKVELEKARAIEKESQ